MARKARADGLIFRSVALPASVWRDVALIGKRTHLKRSEVVRMLLSQSVARWLDANAPESRTASDAPRSP